MPFTWSPAEPDPNSNDLAIAVHSQIVLRVQPSVKELPTFPPLGYYFWDATSRHKLISLGQKPQPDLRMILCHVKDSEGT